VAEKSGLRTSLRLALTFAHLMIGALTVLVLTISSLNLHFAWVLLITLGVFVLLSVLEHLIERAVLSAPEKAANTWHFFAELLHFFFKPLTMVMVGLLGSYAEQNMPTVTDETLRDWVALEQAEGMLEKGEREMIYSIFQFSETLTKEIMVPRMDVLALDIDTTISQARQEFIKAGHSRVPVYEDVIDNIVGLLYAKDLLAVVNDEETIASQRKLLRQAYFVPEVKKVDELLAEMQSRGVHLALVVDEYGGFTGVVTLEDIVEEIVGEIRDEYDTGEEQLYTDLGNNEFFILGRATIDEFNEITGANLSDEYADTLGGYLYGQIGRVPEPGEMVLSDGIEFTIEQVHARRILNVKVRLGVEEEIEDVSYGPA
ncbi:MAG TPA: hemolysin family protein, partial [Anaerolineaceae bacterium]|nr:hemolysin family protein [Anaerolineaceae bacterium]